MQLMLESFSNLTPRLSVSQAPKRCRANSRQSSVAEE
jgi:hypothetical protein